MQQYQALPYLTILVVFYTLAACTNAFDESSMLAQPELEATNLVCAIQPVERELNCCVAGAALLHCKPPFLADCCCSAHDVWVCAACWVLYEDGQHCLQASCVVLLQAGDSDIAAAAVAPHQQHDHH
jgi:hypothetical protein